MKIIYYKKSIFIYFQNSGNYLALQGEWIYSNSSDGTFHGKFHSNTNGGWMNGHLDLSHARVFVKNKDHELDGWMYYIPFNEFSETTLKNVETELLSSGFTYEITDTDLLWCTGVSTGVKIRAQLMLSPKRDVENFCAYRLSRTQKRKDITQKILGSNPAILSM